MAPQDMHSEQAAGASTAGQGGGQSGGHPRVVVDDAYLAGLANRHLQMHDDASSAHRQLDVPFQVRLGDQNWSTAKAVSGAVEQIRVGLQQRAANVRDRVYELGLGIQYYRNSTDDAETFNSASASDFTEHIPTVGSGSGGLGTGTSVPTVVTDAGSASTTTSSSTDQASESDRAR